MNKDYIANLNPPSEVFSWDEKSLPIMKYVKNAWKSYALIRSFLCCRAFFETFVAPFFVFFYAWLTSFLGSGSDAGNINFNIIYNPINNVKQASEIFASVLI